MSKNLVVDLDKSLIKIDLLLLSSKKALLKNPLLIFIMPFWLLRGKGFLKDKLVQRVKINADSLPYNKNVISYIQKRKNIGDKIILATASHYKYAQQIAKYVRFFDEIMASDKSFNLSANNKAAKLVEKFGEKNFDYIGDHKRDIPVWKVADLTIIVKGSNNAKVIKKTKNFNCIIIY